jgi:hypothetical protein
MEKWTFHVKNPRFQDSFLRVDGEIDNKYNVWQVNLLLGDKVKRLNAVLWNFDLQKGRFLVI